MPFVVKRFPITIRLDEYDIRKLHAVCQKHCLSEDELMTQLIDLAAALAFNDDELRDVYLDVMEY